MPEGQSQLDLALKQDGTIFVGQNWVLREKLPAVLHDIYAQSPEKDVVIKADRRLKYREVREIMRIAQQAGFGGVGIEARRREAETP